MTKRSRSHRPARTSSRKKVRRKPAKSGPFTDDGFTKDKPDVLCGVPFPKEEFEIEILEITITVDTFGGYQVTIEDLTTGHIRKLYEPQKALNCTPFPS
jgi:hypothetical protein